VSIKNRLGRLERSTQTQQSEAAKKAEERISREVLRRTTDDELHAYHDALRRMLDGEEPAPEDAAILVRIQELREEVTGGHQAASR
jgi:hypothetical protein